MLWFNVLSRTSLQSTPTLPKLLHDGRNFEDPILFENMVDHWAVNNERDHPCELPCLSRLTGRQRAEPRVDGAADEDLSHARPSRAT